jgi:hypothetical protein
MIDRGQGHTRPPAASLYLQIGQQVRRLTVFGDRVPVAAVSDHGTADALIRIPDFVPLTDEKNIVDEPAPAGGGETLRWRETTCASSPTVSQ